MSSIYVLGLVATTPRHLVTQDGLPITSFRLASVNDKGTTDWYTVVSYNKLAINTAGSVSKGDRVLVSGVLRVRDWDNGERAGTSVEIEADGIGHDLNYGSSVYTRNEIVQTKTHNCSCDNCGK